MIWLFPLLGLANKSWDRFKLAWNSLPLFKILSLHYKNTGKNGNPTNSKDKMSAIVWSNHKPKVGKRYSFQFEREKARRSFATYLVTGADDRQQKMISFCQRRMDSKMLELCSFHFYKILYNHKKRTTRFIIIAFIWEQFCNKKYVMLLLHLWLLTCCVMAMRLKI